MNWDDLRIIAAVRNRQTYAGASKELRLDETTVARRLARIQEDLGFVLFNMVDGHREPTRKCEIILRHIDEISQEITRITKIGREQSELNGTIRIAATASIAEELLAPSLAMLFETYPSLKIELKTSNENLNLSRWETDLAIRMNKPETGTSIIRKLGEIRYYIFQPAQLAKSTKNPIICAYPEELAKTPEMQELNRLGLFQQARFRAANIRIIHTLVSTYKAIGVLPEYLSGDLLEDSNLVATPIKQKREVWLLIQPHLKNDAVTRLAIDWITELFAPFRA